MNKRNIFFIGTFMVLIAIGTLSIRTSSAQGTASPTPTAVGDFDVTMQISGTIQSVVAQSSRVSIVTLEDGTEILVNPATMDANLIVIGQTVTFIVAFNDGEGEQLVAKSIVLAATPEPTSSVTVTPTASATPEPTQMPTGAAEACGSGNTQPVALRLANYFKVPYNEIMGWHCQGYGFGEIAKAYLLAQNNSKLTVTAIFGLRKSGQGWGQIIKQSGVSPSALAPGIVIRGKGQDQGQGNSDKEHDNGNGKGKDKGKD